MRALFRVSKYMNAHKQRMFMKTFIITQFCYCSLVWMFYSRNTETRVNKLHERALRLVYDGSPYLSFVELLKKTNQ